MRFGFPVLALLLTLAAPVLAQVATPVPGSGQALMACENSRFHDAASTDAPAPIAASLKGEGRRLVFRTCRDYDGNMHYFMREPRPNRAGVCRTYEREIFPGTADDQVIVSVLYDGMAPNWYFVMPGWKGLPPDAWTLVHYSRRETALGFLTDEACPPGNDPRYISLFHVTDGTLKSFFAAWSEISRSPETLTAAIRKVVPESPDPNGRRINQRLESNFVTSVFEGRRGITSIGCGDNGLGLGYNDCGAAMGGWVVKFDVTPAGIVFTDFRIRPAF